MEGSLGFVYFLGGSLGTFLGAGLELVIYPLRISISAFDYIGAMFKAFPLLGGGFSLATTTADFMTTFDSTTSSFFPWPGGGFF